MLFKLACTNLFVKRFFAVFLEEEFLTTEDTELHGGRGIKILGLSQAFLIVHTFTGEVQLES